MKIHTDQLGKWQTKVSRKDGTTTITYHDSVIVTFTETEVALRPLTSAAASMRRMNQAAAQFDLGYTVEIRKAKCPMCAAGKRPQLWVRKPDGSSEPVGTGITFPA